MLFSRVFCFAVILLAFSRLAWAELTIEITRGSDNAVPIAVVPFLNTSNASLPVDVSKVVANDLQRSGDFDTLPTSRMLSLPDSSDKVVYRDWRLLGQNYVLVGQSAFIPETQNYEVTYELIDVYGQKRLVGRKLSAKADGLRKLAHLISDSVYEAVIGVRGAFSTKIAYITHKNLSSSKQEYKLWVADADGQNYQSLFTSSQPMLSPSWSNDAQHLAFVSFHSGRPAIYVLHVRSGTMRKLISYRGLNSAPMWSPDDSSLVVTLSKDGNAELYNYDLATDRLERLTNHYGIDTEGSWSPDGKELVFTSDRGGNPQVYLMSLKDKMPKRLTRIGRYNARPRFSTDGRKLYYVHQSEGDFHIAAIDMETGDNRILTSTPLDESPTVSPNGRMIMYATRHNGKGVLSVVSVDGGAKYFLPSAQGDVTEPAWSPFLNYNY